ncbi:Bifunctional pinoresinol-lariciresinol reductase [Linum perenne]
MKPCSVLVVGGTGYIGKRIVSASLDLGHDTYVLKRPETGLDIEKLQLLLSFKRRGAHLVEASFSDHDSLVRAVRLVDVVICTMSGVHFRSHNILLQVLRKLIHMQRFIPSEFGMDPARMGQAMEPGRETFDQKMVVRKAIEEANIPHTYISANCFAGYFVGNLSQLGTVIIYGDGNVKVVYVDEDDVAKYTIKAIEDDRTVNKTVYLRPPENIMSQRELVAVWEKLSGNQLEKIELPPQDFLALMEGTTVAEQAGIGHFYHIFYEGCLTNFEINAENGEEEASRLYPEVEYTRVHDYLKIYL